MEKIKIINGKKCYFIGVDKKDKDLYYYIPEIDYDNIIGSFGNIYGIWDKDKSINFIRLKLESISLQEKINMDSSMLTIGDFVYLDALFTMYITYMNLHLNELHMPYTPLKDIVESKYKEEHKFIIDIEEAIKEIIIKYMKTIKGKI